LGAFGEKLRKQREQRNIALDAISNTTKISTRMLRALEDEHFDQLPGGVFNKGFVRAYARQVGLDEEEAVLDYLAALRESQIQQQSILPDFRASAMKPALPPQPRQQNLPKPDLPKNDPAGTDSLRHDAPKNGSLRNDSAKDDSRLQKLNEDRPVEPRRDQNQNISFPDSAARTPANPTASRFRQKYPAGNPAPPSGKPAVQIPLGKLAAALLLIALAIAFWNSRRHREPDAASHAAAASNHSPAPIATTISAPASAEKQPAPAPTAKKTSAAATQPAAAQPATTPLVATTPVATTPAPTTPGPTISAAKKPATSVPAPAAPNHPSASETNSSNKVTTDSPAIAAKSASKISTAHALKPPPIFTLLIRAEKTTWVSITADGNPVADETLIAPAHTSVHATREVVVKTKNAAGVSFLLNGREIPVQGSEGEAKTYIFNASTVRVMPQAQDPPANR